MGDWMSTLIFERVVILKILNYPWLWGFFLLYVIAVRFKKIMWNAKWLISVYFL